MVSKFLLVPEKRRILAPPFAWIDRRFFFSGFMARLSAAENLLYFFLVLVADKDGLSYYSYDKICQFLNISADEFISAKNNLVKKNLIAFDGQRYQVLQLPERPISAPPRLQPDSDQRRNELASLGEILERVRVRQGGLTS